MNGMRSNGIQALTRKSPSHFYLFALPASTLRRLSTVQRRSTRNTRQRNMDLGIQRYHDTDRSAEISRFVHFGYPWSDIQESQRSRPEYSDLRKPGWLPTAIIVNILKPGDKGGSSEISSGDCVKLSRTSDGMYEVIMPANMTDKHWNPPTPPLEIIDGQHRLLSFDPESSSDFQLPVVAFCGLDISWQAYLFWTINVKPKTISASLAFDLLPILRTQDWLNRFVGPSVYRETRSQELVEALWSYIESPWHARINMLGEPASQSGDKRPMVSQPAWIRSLMATYVKSWEAPKLGGLFGTPVGHDETVLPWKRPQQSAFLIYLWKVLRSSIGDCSYEWANALRSDERSSAILSSADDPAFYSQFSLLTTDQGVRGVLAITNDLCYVEADRLKLVTWESATDSTAIEPEILAAELAALAAHPAAQFLAEIANALTKYDWRTSSALGLSAEEQRAKSALRGSGGYRQLRMDLVTLLSHEGGGVGIAAREAGKRLGYTQV
jgi:hypothetical protein